jgi:hypothetical protein
VADDVHDTIEQLVAEEHALWDAEAAGNATEADRDRLAKIKVDLDRYWDLLRRRRAAAAAGQSTDSVELRSAETVESYEQ